MNNRMTYHTEECRNAILEASNMEAPAPGSGCMQMRLGYGRAVEKQEAISLLRSTVEPGVTLRGKRSGVRGAAMEWSSYGGDKASSKYSPLDQIGTDNFNRLKVV
jgi:hypothetical protein